MFLKNLPYLSRIDIIDSHSGSDPEYRDRGYTRRLSLVNGVWEITHLTTGITPYCFIDGSHRPCKECVDFIDGLCRNQHETMTVEEIMELSKKYRSYILLDNKGKGFGVIDTTGHVYSPCSIDGGCIICHPCKHDECYDRPNPEPVLSALQDVQKAFYILSNILDHTDIDISKGYPFESSLCEVFIDVINWVEAQVESANVESANVESANVESANVE